MHPRLIVKNNEIVFDISKSCNDVNSCVVNKFYIFYDEDSICRIETTRKNHVVHLETIPLCIVQRTAEKMKIGNRYILVLSFEIYLQNATVTIKHSDTRDQVLHNLRIISAASSRKLALKILELVMNYEVQELSPEC